MTARPPPVIRCDFPGCRAPSEYPGHTHPTGRGDEIIAPRSAPETRDPTDLVAAASTVEGAAVLLAYIDGLRRARPSREEVERLLTKIRSASFRDGRFTESDSEARHDARQEAAEAVATLLSLLGYDDRGSDSKERA